MLSRIENGTVAPSLGTLQALASALGVSLTSLLGRYNETSKVVFVAASRETDDCHHNPLRYLILKGSCSFNTTALDVRLVRLHSKADRPPPLVGAGTFFLHCLSGEVIYTHADSHYQMAAGDSLMFNASAPHGITEATQLPLKLLVVRAGSNNPT
jgi:hypothetical protein